MLVCPLAWLLLHIHSQAWEKTLGISIRDASHAESYEPRQLADQITTTSNSIRRIGFIGLGAMGFGMATNLIKSNFCVIGYDVWLRTLHMLIFHTVCLWIYGIFYYRFTSWHDIDYSDLNWFFLRISVVAFTLGITCWYDELVQHSGFCILLFLYRY